MGFLSCLTPFMSRRHRGSRGRKKGKPNVTPEERAHIHELRVQGLTVAAIGKEVGRSPTSVSKALREATTSFAMAEPDDDGGPHGHVVQSPAQWRQRLLEGAEPRLVEALEDLLEAKPALTEDLVRRLGHLPKRTLTNVLEEGAIEEFENSPELKHRAAEAFLKKYSGSNRTEAEVVTEAFERAFVMFAAILAEARVGAGFRTLDHAIASGEASKIVSEVAAAFGSRSGGQSEGTQNAKAVPAASGEVQPMAAEVGSALSEDTYVQPEVDERVEPAPTTPEAPSVGPLLQPTPPAPSNGSGPST